MTRLVDALPDFREQPAHAEPSAVMLQARRFEFDRRTMLRLAAGAAVGVGLATLDLIGRALPGWAVEPHPVFAEWSSCHGFFDASTICVPNTAYFGTGVPGVCSGSWHRNYSYTGGFGELRLHVQQHVLQRDATRGGGPAARGGSAPTAGPTTATAPPIAAPSASVGP